MLLTEHAAKLLFAEAGIPVPQGAVVLPGEADGFAAPFPGPFVVKSQVLAGGRGKAGGVRLASDETTLRQALKDVFALPIKGQLPPYIRVEPAAHIEKECYLSLAVSRARKSLVLTAGGQGGVDVERSAPLCQDVPLPKGPDEHHIRAAFFHLGIDHGLWKPFRELVKRLFALTASHGLLLAEINPLAVADGALCALDGKIEIDDNFAQTRPDFERFHDARFANAEEAKAREKGLSFIKLSGWVGLMVNGAGLAMVTMDLLNLSGLPAANFLDLGGAADVNRMRSALDLLFDDPAVGAVFINLYGGILSCGKVAEAVRAALEGKPPKKPLVARLSGNSAEEGRALLRDLACRDIHVVKDMDEAIAILATLGEKSEPMRLPRIEAVDGREKKTPGRTDAARPVAGPSPLRLGRESAVCVQGITGKTATLHVRLMREYGTRVVCGVTPFKGGQLHEGVPVFNSVHEARARFDIEASLIFVPGPFAADSILEAADAGVPFAICITEGIPQQDMLAACPLIDATKTTLIGPNTPGVIVPGAFKAGIMPVTPFLPGGRVAVFSRSGTLTYEASRRLSKAGIGQAVGVGIGGDPFIGAGFVELAEMVREDDRVDAVLVLGEIGGDAEERLAAYVRATNYPKPVVAFIAGVTAPPGRRLGHAGAIIDKDHGVADKLARLAEAGITVCRDLGGIAPAVASAL